MQNRLTGKDVFRPNFIGIGMAKSGTSWLYSILRQHPDIWMPPLKELHFFDDYFWYVMKGDKSRYFASDRYSRDRWRRYLVSEFKRTLRFPSTHNAIWTLRFLLGKRDFDWYSSLFPNTTAVVCGEFTPEYSVLEPCDIQEIYRRFPWLKIVLLLRSPIDRAWSHAKMELALRPGKAVVDLSNETLLRFLMEEGVQRRGKYTRIIKNWTNVFGGHKLFIGLYEQIQNEPDVLIGDLCRFLNIRTEKIPELNDLNEVVFGGLPGEMPVEIRSWLQEEFFTEIQDIACYLDRKNLLKLWQ